MQKQPTKPSLKKNIFFNMVYQLVQIGIPILLIPILSGRLKTDGNGNYAFLHSIVLYFSYFALLGVNYYGTRTIAKQKVSGELDKKKTFWVIFFAKAITSIIAIAGYLAFSFIYWQNHFVLFTQLFFLVANFLDVSWLFSGDENFKSLCIRNVIIKTASLVLIILFVKTQSDIGIYSLILGLAEVANQLFMWALLIKKKYFKKECFSNVSFKNIFIALKGMLIFFIPQLLIELYTILNTTILGIVWGRDSYGEVGIFDYANKIVSVLTTITVSLGMVFLARLSSLNEENKDEEVKIKIKQSLYCSLSIAIPLVIGVIGTGHSFIRWFLSGDDWSKVGILLYFLPLKVIFVAISNTIGIQYLISTGKMKKYIISVASGAVVCIVLNAILVKPLGSIGSAISVVVAEACVTVVQCLLIRKEVSILPVIGKLWKTLVAGISMAAFLVISYLFFYQSITLFVSSFIANPKAMLALSDVLIMLLAALVYFAVLIALKEKLVSRALRRIKINESHNTLVWATTLTLVFCVALSVGFYKPYNIRYESDFTIQRRTAAASMDSSNNIKITYKDIYQDSSKKVSTISKDKLNDALQPMIDGEEMGYTYHINEKFDSVDIISYKFYFFQCQDYGTTFKVNLRYCLEKSEFLLNNIDKLHIFVDVQSHKHEDAPKAFIDLNNDDNVLSDYFSNDNRVFIKYDNSDILWKDDDFKCEKIDNKIYKDNYYCTISICFIEDEEKDMGVTIKDTNIKQEVWLLGN